MTPDSGGGGLTQVQGIGCFPPLTAWATVETPMTGLLARTVCPLRLLTPLLQLYSWPCVTQVLPGACHSPVWKVGCLLGAETVRCLGYKGGLEINMGAWPTVKSS